jgi:endonuclease-3
MTPSPYPDLLSRYADYLGHSHPLFALEDERSPWFYTASVILSGNTTDAAVNAIMPAFKERFPTPESILEEGVNADIIIPFLRAINHNGAKSDYLQNAARHIIEHKGETAQTMAGLTKVKGIGRKSAAIILYHLYGVDEGFPLDTHCNRVLKRLGWFTERNPKSLENALLRVFPEGSRHKGYLILTHHGREVCSPAAPQCSTCRLANHCAFAKAQTSA